MTLLESINKTQVVLLPTFNTDSNDSVEIEKAIDRLVELGYNNDTEWNNYQLDTYSSYDKLCIHIFNDKTVNIFLEITDPGNYLTTTFESFSDFENQLGI